MAGGTLIHREWVLVLQSGDIVIDWGEGIFQDVRSGEFLRVPEREVSHRADDEIMEWLKRAGRVVRFDAKLVEFANLPERPLDLIE
jgi:hypothetical protein